MTELRPGRTADIEDMVNVQNAIYRAGLRSYPADTDSIRSAYFDPEHQLALTVAVRDETVAPKGRTSVVVGFQSLKRAWPGNPYGVEPGWGIIGTHIQPDAGRSGIGRRLFAVSLAAARAAGLEHIDATIGADNPGALAYYRAMGFVPYQDGDEAIPHRLDVSAT